MVGSFLRKDHPLFALRLRQAARHGAQIMSIHASEDDWLMPVAARITTAPSSWVQALADVATAVAAANGVTAPAAGTATEAAQAIADALLSGQQKAILLGNAAAEHPQAASLLSLANWIAAQTGASVGYLTAAANTVGAQLVNALPQQGGLNAGQMLSNAGLIAICSIASPDPSERDRAAGFAAPNRFLEVPAKDLPARDEDAVEVVIKRLEDLGVLRRKDRFERGEGI